MKYQLAFMPVFSELIEKKLMELQIVFFIKHIDELYGNKIKLRQEYPMKYQILHY